MENHVYICAWCKKLTDTSENHECRTPMNREMYIIRMVNSDNNTAGYHRGETGLCYDRRDAKIYQNRADAEGAARFVNKTSIFRAEVEVRN